MIAALPIKENVTYYVFRRKYFVQLARFYVCFIDVTYVPQYEGVTVLGNKLEDAILQDEEVNFNIKFPQIGQN